MKKVFMFLAALCVAMVSFAQDLDFTDVNPNKFLDAKRQAKIEKISKQEAANTGDPKVDEFINSSILGAAAAISSSDQLREMYKRQIGATDENGVTDVTITKPNLEDWVGLSAKLAMEAKSAADAAILVKEVSENAKKLGGAKAIKVAKAVVGAGDNWKTIGEEVGAQIKAVDAIIKTIKSGNNI